MAEHQREVQRAKAHVRNRIMVKIANELDKKLSCPGVKNMIDTSIRENLNAAHRPITKEAIQQERKKFREQTIHDLTKQEMRERKHSILSILFKIDTNNCFGV